MNKMQKQFKKISKKHKLAWDEIILKTVFCPHHIGLKDKNCSILKELVNCQKCWKKSLKEGR